MDNVDEEAEESGSNGYARGKKERGTGKRIIRRLREHQASRLCPSDTPPVE